MTIRLFTVTPELLKPRWLVHFSKGFKKEWAEKHFRVLRIQQLGHEKHRIIGAGTSHDIDLSAELAEHGGLYPDLPTSLYEILVGWKPKQALMYPRLPTTDYVQKLEMTGWVPPAADKLPTEHELRYLGEFSGVDSPYDQPKLRIHTVKDMAALAFRFYADSPEDEKVVARFIINRCMIQEMRYEELTEKEKAAVREIYHYSLVGAGRWG